MAVDQPLTEAPAATAARGLHSGFLASSERFPDRPAVEVAGREHSYAELRELALRIAATLAREAPHAEPALTGVFAYRSLSAFAGVLGALLGGHGYVPLNRTHPPARVAAMIGRIGARAIVADRESAEQLAEMELDQPLVVLLPEENDVSELAELLPQHRLVGAGELEPAGSWEPPEIDPDAMAYVIFTSGSTGVPKGVMVAHRNVHHYVDYLIERYEISEQDRFSQTHDMTFDNSVFDMFVAWERGACVCCPSQKTLIKPGGFINDSRITVWFSVPSTAIFMKRLGMLKPGQYPTLRWSLFAGEALPLESAQAWAEAAPGSTVENLYGPTEVTVDCTLYRFDPATSPPECEHGVVPIGHALPDMELYFADGSLAEVAPGEPGELLVAGPQVTLGYWRDEEKTAAAFVELDGREGRFYRTGDLVRRPASPGEPIAYLGRIDNQIKIRGVRVELGEIEAALREASGSDAVVALGWPKTLSGANGVVAFIGDPDVEPDAVRAQVEERLPGHMVPRRIHLLPELPLNTNGKFDRRALEQRLEESA